MYCIMYVEEQRSEVNSDSTVKIIHVHCPITRIHVVYVSIILLIFIIGIGYKMYRRRHAADYRLPPRQSYTPRPVSYGFNGSDDSDNELTDEEEVEIGTTTETNGFLNNPVYQPPHSVKVTYNPDRSTYRNSEQLMAEFCTSIE